MKTFLVFLFGLGVGWPACVLYYERHRDQVADRLENELSNARATARYYEGALYKVVGEANAAKLELDRLRRIGIKQRTWWWLDATEMPTAELIPLTDVPTGRDVAPPITLP